MMFAQFDAKEREENMVETDEKSINETEKKATDIIEGRLKVEGNRE